MTSVAVAPRENPSRTGRVAHALRALLAVAALAVASPCGAWTERTGGDLPWLGSGGRAHLYEESRACFGCTTGSQHEERWGRSSLSGPSPYATITAAMNYLAGTPMMRTAPAATGAGSAVTESGEVVTARALPYQFTVVMIDPTVVVMSFDLTALVRGVAGPEPQAVGSPWIDGYVHYGTHVPATGTLLWFSPEAAQPPIAVAGQASGVGEIAVRNARLRLTRQGDQWIVTRP